jgi:hypothetical protein
MAFDDSTWRLGTSARRVKIVDPQTSAVSSTQDFSCPANWVEKIKVSLGQRAGLSLMLLAAATIGLAATQALAADLPRKAPVYVPPAPPPIC